MVWKSLGLSLRGWADRSGVALDIDDGFLGGDVEDIDPRTGTSYRSEVVVWQDANHDGVTNSGELETLSQLGVTSIDLAGVASAGGLDRYATTYTTSDGTLGEAPDVDLSGNSLGDQIIAASAAA